MIINKSDLKTGPAPELYHEDGCINSVLVYSKKLNHCDYISRWGVSNTMYYNKHIDDYLGWIDLEQEGYNLSVDPSLKNC